MKAKGLIKLIKPYKKYEIVSDSGWECSETDIGGAYINHDDKKIILVQYIYEDDRGYYIEEAKRKYGENVKVLFKGDAK